MEVDKLLELYTEEIKNGEVKEEDLLDYNKMLDLNFRTQRYEIIKIMEKTIDLHMYFLKNLYFPKMPLYWAMEGSNTDEENKRFDRVKQTAKLFLYSNASKIYNFK